MPDALIIAHGAPADPEPQERHLQALAQAVAAQLSGWRVRGATLAAEGALAAALEGLQRPVIYPFFMAEGWFTGTHLPKRLAEAGAVNARQVAPFGVDPALPDLMALVAENAARAAGIAPQDSTLLLAAHGSKVSKTSTRSTYEMAEALRQRTGFARILCGFIEEAPFLAEAARGLAPAICLPFFALRAGHVAGDLPEALEEAGFTGPLLPAIGEHPEVPALIAAALLRAEAQTPDAM